QIGFAMGGFAPVIAAAVQGEGPNAWVPVALLNAAICVVASIAAWTARETYNIPMHDLGSHTAAAAPPAGQASKPALPHCERSNGWSIPNGLLADPTLCSPTCPDTPTVSLLPTAGSSLSTA